MPTLPCGGNYSGTKRSLALKEPADQRAFKLRLHENTSPPAETGSPSTGADNHRGGLHDRPVHFEVGERAMDSEERIHDFQGTVLRIRTLSNDTISASSFVFAGWLVQNRSILDGRRVLQLKSGTGSLAIFLRKALGVDITTSDFDDEETEDNIAYNCKVNNLPVLPHMRHTWGDPFPVLVPDWDIVIASDIEPYAEQSTNLAKTLAFLLQEGQRAGRTDITNKSGVQVPVRFPMSLISWRGQIDPSDLFWGCERQGLEVQHLGCLVYLIKKKN